MVPARVTFRIDLRHPENQVLGRRAEASARDHAEHEWADPAHVAAGAEVLADVMWDLAFPGKDEA